MKELNVAIQQIGSGVGIDGIPPKVANILPTSLKSVIVELLNKVFLVNTPQNGVNKSFIPLRKMDIHQLIRN